MEETFASFVRRRIIADENLSEEELTLEDCATAEDVLAVDELCVDSEELDTMAYEYRQQCEEQGHEPDFTGYEDYE